ncbi:MAG: DegT/DnrJ/EryC1/StrS family aminotransferase [Anaerolineae bacterium]|nr:DegT/DnrJ/EryC1/StrS family aminotransferase [Anaerolineae bacterium]
MPNSNDTLALLGGPEAVNLDPGNTFTWPIVTEEDEQAVLSVLRKGTMSEIDVTMDFEADFAAWQGSRYALGFNNGTNSLQAAMFSVGVGVGGEVICPSLTYWASILPCYSLGATPVFTDINPETLCMDPRDIEHRITDQTQAIMVVHYVGHPADMDAMMNIANQHQIPVIEDVSHAQGGLYKGRKTGTFGKVNAMSLMSGKSLPIGEGGILVTDDVEMYERAIAFGHYRRYNDEITSPELAPYRNLPMGGIKGRMNQLCSAMGCVQLRHYDQRAAEIRQALNYFWDLLEGTPGLQAHRVPSGADSNMAGWYSARGLYHPEELGGLSVTRFAQAVTAEGSVCSPGLNLPLHLHPLFNQVDVYGHGRPTRIANSHRDVRQPRGSLPVSESIGARAYLIPQFKKYNPEVIEQHAAAYRKAANHYQDLRDGDPGNPPGLTDWACNVS